MQSKDVRKQSQQIKGIVIGVLTITVITIVGSPMVHAAPVDTNIDAQAAIVVDAESGQIIAQQNMDKVLPAASTSKLMTAYLVNQAINKDKLFNWDSPVKISRNVAKVSTEAQTCPLKSADIIVLKSSIKPPYLVQLMRLLWP